MASEVELEALNSINISKLKNTKSRSAFLIWEYTHLVDSNEPIRNKNAYFLFYYKYRIESYAI